MHPEHDRWIALASGELSGAEERELSAHLAGCPACRDTEHAVRRVVQAMMAGPPPLPSDAATRAAIDAFGARLLPRGLPDRVRELKQRWIDLVFDSLAPSDALFAGARGSVPARRVRFEADDLELDVLVETSPGGRRLVLQVSHLGHAQHPLPETSVFICAGGNVVTSGETDAYGQYRSALVEVSGDIEVDVAAATTLARFRIPDEVAPS
jgi:anti-sigma factor RsiW